MLDSITSELVGVSSRDFFPSTSREAGVIKLAQYLQCPPPKICNGKKIVQNFSQFLTTFDFDGEYLGKALDHPQPLPRWSKKVGVLWSTNEKVIDSNKFTP